MTDHAADSTIRVAFDADLPHARWGPLFHVFRLEQPGAGLEWRPARLPARERPLLEEADVGLFLEPPQADGHDALTLDSSPVVVLVAAGDPLAHRHELAMADILDRPFPGCPALHPGWAAFWTLDAYRGGAPAFTHDDVRTAEQGLEVIAAGSAIGTAPSWVASGLTHPGVIALPLRDGPKARARLVWRSDDQNPLVRSLVELAGVWSAVGGARPA